MMCFSYNFEVFFIGVSQVLNTSHKKSGCFIINEWVPCNETAYRMHVFMNP